MRALHKSLSHISIEHNVIFFENCDSILLGIAFGDLSICRIAMVVLSLNEVASKHLGVLDFNLGVVENEIVVVDVLNNFYWLLLVLLLWL